MSYYNKLCYFITTLGKFNLILGMPWLEQHDLKVSFRTRTLKFDSYHCTAHCLSQGKASIMNSCSSTKVNKDISFEKSRQDGYSTQQNIRHDITEISAYAFMAMAEKEDYQVAALWPKNFEELNVKMDYYTPVLTSDFAAITPENYDKFFSKIRKKPYIREELRQMIPSEYYKYIDVWDPVAANQLPPHRNIDHQIRLIDGSIPVVKKAYGFSLEEAAVVKEYIDEMLGKGFIRRSIRPILRRY